MGKRRKRSVGINRNVVLRREFEPVASGFTLSLLRLSRHYSSSSHREADGPNAIRIPEVSVSKHHARLSYEKAIRRFVVNDEKSQNGTFLNEERLSKVRQGKEGTERVGIRWGRGDREGERE